MCRNNDKSLKCLILKRNLLSFKIFSINYYHSFVCSFIHSFFLSLLSFLSFFFFSFFPFFLSSLLSSFLPHHSLPINSYKMITHQSLPIDSYKMISHKSLPIRFLYNDSVTSTHEMKIKISPVFTNRFLQNDNESFTSIYHVKLIGYLGPNGDHIKRWQPRWLYDEVEMRNTMYSYHQFNDELSICRADGRYHQKNG